MAVAEQGSIGRLSWKAIQPFGVEIDFDFRQPMTDDERASFRRLLFERRLLLMRRQSLSLAQQQDLAECIGPVLRGSRGMAYVAPDDGILNEEQQLWHSDLAFAPEPFTALSLMALDVEEEETCTLFADAVGGLQTLAPSLKAAIADRQALFLMPARADTRQSYIADEPGDRGVMKPLVLSHPETGQPLIFANEGHVRRIAGMERQASRDLLDAVYDHLYGPANVLEHRWRRGDLILWDNIGLQHARPAIHGVRRRKLQRASVCERSLLEQIPDYFDHRAEVRTSNAV